ncbi:MAG: alpha/beta fold hydrolase [Actinobacteria bacterium]|nr:alpha/beta fold hydrolase [Actinomycetota bacterium]
MTEYLEREGWAMAYDDTGGSAQALMLCHALGADRAMWDPQVEMLGPRQRLIRFDHRGHGESGAPPPPYTMADLGGDVIALADHVGVDRFDFCGISMGGQVGLWVAVHHRDRVGRLALANTGAKIGTREGWDERIATVERDGMGAIADVVVERFFSEAWRDAHPGRRSGPGRRCGPSTPAGTPAVVPPSGTPTSGSRRLRSAPAPCSSGAGTTSPPRPRSSNGWPMPSPIPSSPSSTPLISAMWSAPRSSARP